jgi:ribosome-binding factor A
MVSPDLGYAKIYLTFLNEKEPLKALELIKLHTGEVRKVLGSHIRNEVRKIPEISFFYDDTLDYMEKIDELLKKIDKKN